MAFDPTAMPVGLRVGRLTVAAPPFLRPTGKRACGHPPWLIRFRCDCGATCELRPSDLTNAKQRDCGAGCGLRKRRSAAPEASPPARLFRPQTTAQRLARAVSTPTLTAAVRRGVAGEVERFELMAREVCASREALSHV